MSSTPPATAAAQNPRLLHLGCGLIAPSEWVNVDGSRNAWLAQRPTLKKALVAMRLVSRSQAAVPWPTNITVADLRGKLPFPENSFDAVYSSHTLEHLHRDEALRLLRESFRVLKPGRPCRTLVPDLRAIVQEYLGQIELKLFSEEDEAPLRQDPARRLCHRMMMRSEAAPGGGENVFFRMYRAATDHHLHKWMYDGPSLVRLMSDAGFADCRERGYLDSEIPHLDKVEQSIRILDGNGVAVEGRKP